MTAETSDERGLGRATIGVVAVVVVAVLAAMLYLSETRETPVAAPAPTEPEVVRLDFAVYGPQAEIDAYEKVVEEYNQASEYVDVTVESWPDAESMLADLKAGAVSPDLYLLPRSALKDTIDNERNIELLDLLDARGISLGDDFSRDSVAAYSYDDDLQCMPYATSPMVMYYNTDLIDFDRMAARGLPVPNEERSAWTLDMFRAAAEFASRPRKGSRGVYIDPTLEGISPFVLSGGGSVYDDPVSPTSLALSEGDSVDALTRTLEVLRDPQLTLTSQQLDRRSGLEWFEQGKVGMIAGYRDLTPQLRDVDGLRFDVMPMPNLGTTATVGNLTGVCIGAGAAGNAGEAADFLVHLVSDEAVSEISEVGYLQPTNVKVSYSEAFQQSDQQPEHSEVFTSAVRAIQLMPLLDDPDALESVVAPQIRQLFSKPVLGPEELTELLGSIDAASAEVLADPADEETEDPSDGASETASPSEDATD
ncbi:extracellular solute-binding protein [Nocardioides sambongensis]|uniref:extracellular solute-binding protein n=1 Tax=Nocardioides sambongensis TaxID=2589074 RepID=UPI00112A41B4|nr:extracellular solute-binding protein [Nocardioides sambongensis]